MTRENEDGPSPPAMWAYGYEINPSLARDRLSIIESLLDEEHFSRKLGGRRWSGRLVTEEQVTHILVVSDSPEQDLDVNHRLEVELQRVEAVFSVTAPLMVADDSEASKAWNPPSGEPPFPRPGPE